jgi:nucleoside diphosphate kinase
VAIKKQSISKQQAKGFYAVHAGKPFFDGLTAFMSSGPLVLMVLEKENAIADLRKLMGATNPASAEEGTHPQEIRRLDDRRTPSTAPTPKIRLPSRSATGSPVTS